MSSSNFHEVASPEQFQSLLSQDLSRVSLINFWAPWAEPCKNMNELVLELAKKYPQILVVQVLLTFIGLDDRILLTLRHVNRLRRKVRKIAPSRLKFNRFP